MSVAQVLMMQTVIHQGQCLYAGLRHVVDEDTARRWVADGVAAEAVHYPDSVDDKKEKPKRGE